MLLLTLPQGWWASDFVAALSSLSQQAERTACLDDARAAWNTGQFDVMILVGRSDEDQRRPLETLLSSARMRSLAVVPRDDASDAPWLSLVADVLFWPADWQELQFRLRRLVPAGRPPAADPLMALLARAELIGSSPIFVESLRILPRLVGCDANVLISGETGTGKDIVARAIHYLGGRSSGPFVPVNCGALPDALFENELFGHARGAYTHAATAQDGLVAQARHGTLFLDEVDTLSPRSQAALLRFLQDGQFRPLGSGATRTSDVRVIAATNARLADLVASGAFREDLFYRLNLLGVDLPPLRDRREDVVLLARHVLDRLSRRYKQDKRIAAGTLAWLSAREWRGNVRELENWIHRQFLLSSGDLIEHEPGQDTDHTPANDLRFRVAKQRAIAEFECRYLTELISATRGNVSQASRRSGTERRTFGRLLRKHAIDPSSYR